MRTFNKATEGIIGITLMIVTFLLFINIILRFFFSSGITWVEEFIRYGIIWITFIGSAVCFQRGSHVAVDLLLDFVPSKGKRLLSFIIHILAAIFMAFLIKYGIDLVNFSKSTGQLAPALQIEMSWIYLAIPVGAALSFIQIIIQIVLLFKNGGQEPAQQGGADR